MPTAKAGRPLNVLFLLPGSFASNSALHVAALANELSLAGHACAVAVPHDLATLAHHAAPLFRGLLHREAEAGVTFAKAEGIIPAPEATHAIAQVIREANMAKLEGKPRTILFNMCGHGFVDMQAYADYFDGKLNNHEFTEEELFGNLPEIDALQPTA